MIDQKQKILVLGLGESGLAMARWLTRTGAIVCVADTRSAPDRLPDLRQLNAEIEFVGGSFGLELLNQIDLIAVSPGLSPLKELSKILPAAQEKNIPIWSELEFFAHALKDLQATHNYMPKVIAITGTNGKTTVTRLTGLLMQRAGWTVQMAGNISPSILDCLCDCLDTGTLPQVWVLEVSSFQLHHTYSFNPDVATVLNITQDHLDWHGSMDAYCEDKAKIFRRELDTKTIRILNRNDPRVMKMIPASGALWTVGIDAPVLANDFGLVRENGMYWLAVAMTETPEQQSRTRKRNPEVVQPVTVHHLMPAAALPIRGQHNALNALTALALCRAIDVPLAPLLHAVREYRGEPHRVEWIATVGGVRYIDDSKGTNVGATVAALNSLGQEQGQSRLLLIAGGEGKGQDFSPLAAPVGQYVRAVLLIGQDAPNIGAALNETGVEIIACDTLVSAVEEAALRAQTGDLILLSPACASLDMFKNYVHRAEVFKEAVHELALSRGEVAA